MDDSGSESSWLWAYLLFGVLALVVVLGLALVAQRRQQKRERRAAAKAASEQFRAWRDGKPPPAGPK